MLTGLFATSDADLVRAGGFNVDVCAALGMPVVAGAFLAWARLRPILVPTDDDTAPEDGSPEEG